MKQYQNYSPKAQFLSVYFKINIVLTKFILQSFTKIWLHVDYAVKKGKKYTHIDSLTRKRRLSSYCFSSQGIKRKKRKGKGSGRKGIMREKEMHAFF